MGRRVLDSNSRVSKGWRTVLKTTAISVVCLIGLYAYIVPKGPDVGYHFMQGAKRKQCGIDRGGDLAPAVLEYGWYELDASYETVLGSIKKELVGCRSQDISWKGHRSYYFKFESVEVDVTAPGKYDDGRRRDKVEVAIIRSLPRTTYHQIQFFLFCSKKSGQRGRG